jgi:ubiquinone/menaquinone biosynthesis C-methylase UbiE
MMLISTYAVLIDPLLKNIRRRIPEFSGMKAGDKVIDVCCGTGAQVIEYGHLGIVATGIDIDPGMLKIATRNSVKQKTTNVSFQLADATKLPFPDGYFCYTSISLALHDKEKHIRNQIISEMKRVTKKDGALILIDFHVPLPGNVWSIIARAIESFVGGTHHQNFKEYITNNGLGEIIRNNGLREKDRTSLMNGLFMVMKLEIS